MKTDTFNKFGFDKTSSESVLNQLFELGLLCNRIYCQLCNIPTMLLKCDCIVREWNGAGRSERSGGGVKL